MSTKYIKIAQMLLYFTVLFFRIYTWMLIIRILASWIPNVYQYRIMHFLMFYTDPYLNIFRRIIPPIGGVLDISPLLGFIALRFIEKFVIQLVLYL